MKKALFTGSWSHLILTISFIFLNTTSYGQLITVNTSGNLVYNTYSNIGETNSVNKVPDFSNCGYMGGGVGIPTISTTETLSPISGDDRSNIQAAIDRVSALPLQSNGFRGSVLLRKGTYEVSSTLNINASGVVLKGEGQDSLGTKLILTATVQSTLIKVTGTGVSTEVSGSRTSITTSYVPTGGKVFNVSSTSGYSVGSKIVVLFTPNQAWIDALNMAQYGWTPAEYQMQYERTITAISGNQITIDIPIVQAIQTQYGGGSIYRYTYAGRINKSGVENMRLVSSYTSDSDEDHGWNAIYFSAAENCWAKQVTALYFGYSCVQAGTGAKFITVEECAQLDPISLIQGSRRYSFVINNGAQMILVQRCYTRRGRHDFVTNSRVAGPNAFVDCLATIVKEEIGPHHRYATGLLFDNINGGNMGVYNRGSQGTGHGWAGAQNMFWNCKSTARLTVDSPPAAMNWGIGCTSDTKVGAGYFESYGTRVIPRSLYLEQLKARLGSTAVSNIAKSQQLTGDIWTALSTWAGQGKLFASGGGTGGTSYTVDNTDAGFSTTGTWPSSTGIAGAYYGTNYLINNNTATTDVAKWTSPITTTGNYDVYMRWPAAADRADAAPVEVNYNGGSVILNVNQTLNSATWVKIGTWSFTGGSGDYVSITASDAGYTIADAVRWVSAGGAVGSVSTSSALNPGASKREGFRIVPNPVSNTARLGFTAPVAGRAKVAIFNLAGQTVFKTDRTVTEGNNDLEINVQDLPSGTYIVKLVLGDKEVMTGKLMKE